MFDQVFDSFRRATETTLQAQQDLFRQWMTQWSTFPMIPGTPAAGSEEFHALKKQWTDCVTALMTQHCNTLDAQYRAGIKSIEDALRTADVKSPEEFRRLTEDLWSKSFEVLKQTIENQFRDFQAAIEKWSELVTRAKP